MGKSTAVREWLEEQIRTLQPGAMLPPGRELAACFDVSIATIQRLLSEYHGRGTLQRITGRGTFIPGKKADLPPVRREVLAARSAESVAEMLYAGICDGTYRAGDIFPSVKFLTIDRNISRSTAVDAFRILIKRGVVHKVGRAHVAGAPHVHAVSQPGRDVYFFAGKSDKDINFIHTEHPYAQAYRVMEAELQKNTYRIIYAPLDSFEKYAGTWMTGDKPLPDIVLGHFIGLAGYHELEPDLKKLLEKRGHAKPRILVTGKITRKRIENVFYMNPGHHNTEVYRGLSRHIAQKKYKRLMVCFDTRFSKYLGLTFSSTLKIWSECMHRCRDLDIRYHVRPGDGDISNPGDFFQRMSANTGADLLAAKLSKYRENNLTEISDYVRITRSFSRVFGQAGPGDIWVFAHDALAGQALDFWQKKKMACPDVISLDNDPRYFYRGISACVIDQVTLGYQMAQAVMGTYPVSRSSHGYLNAPVQLIHRETTAGGSTFKL